jgi:hypothetical protein
MQLIEVTDDMTARGFLQVNADLHKNDPNYIRPLDKDVNEVFDEKKNKAFRFGEVKRWILKNDEGSSLGRIAAFVNKKYKNKGDDVPVGGIGFFDCINDQETAEILFNVAKHWLLQKGMEAMDGPVNFGERDRWWGLVVKGFEPPLYCMNYNPPYYQELFENYGFRNFFNQVCFGLKVSDRVQQKFYDRHDACAADPNFSAVHIKKDQLRKFARDFASVYNKSFAGHGGMKELPEPIVQKMFKSMKAVIDEKISWFVYYKGEPVAMWLNLPDLNQWFKHLDGKFTLWHKLKFLWMKKFKKCDKFVGLAFGLIPEWQGKGVDSYMIMEGAKVIQAEGLYEKYEMQWIGEFNPKMINIAENLPTHRSRILTTYRYLFDRTKEFKRHPIL